MNSSAQELPQIDPVELMLIAIGMRPIISREVEKLSRSQLGEMAKLPSRIVRLSRELTKGEITESHFGRDSYRDLLVDLARGWDIEQVQAMLETVPPELHPITSAVLVKSSQIIKEMDKELPVSKYITISGETKLSPPDSKMFRFLAVLEVLDHPLVVFDLMSTGALLQSQAQAVRMIYPSLAAGIDMAIFEAVSRARASKASFQLPSRAERGVKAWFGKSPITLDAMKRAQETAKGQAKQDEDRKEAMQDQKMAKSEMTQVQRTEQV